MATIKLSAPAESIRGTTGKSLTWYPRGDRQFVRKWKSPKNIQSDFQQSARNWLTDASRYWISNLSYAERSAWDAYAAQYPKLDANGDTYYISGFSLFLATYFWRFQADETPIDNPGLTYISGTNPIYLGGTKLELVTDGVASSGDVLRFLVGSFSETNFYIMRATKPFLGQVPKPFKNKLRLISSQYTNFLMSGSDLTSQEGYFSCTRGNSPFGEYWPKDISASGTYFIRFQVQTLNAAFVPNATPAGMPGGFITIVEA